MVSRSNMVVRHVHCVAYFIKSFWNRNCSSSTPHIWKLRVSETTSAMLCCPEVIRLNSVLDADLLTYLCVFCMWIISCSLPHCHRKVTLCRNKNCWNNSRDKQLHLVTMAFPNIIIHFRAEWIRIRWTQVSHL